MRWLASAVVMGSAMAAAQTALSGGPPEGKAALAAGEFAKAKVIYREYVRAHPGSLAGELGLADAELALHEYEAAELEYRAITAQQPELWPAHKNLVLIEAALGRWDEFDRERALLRGARERGAPGISAHESDTIDAFDVPASNRRAAQRWIVREYYEPAGRSLTRYNFERFSSDGRVQAYLSLESAKAAEAALSPNDVRIGPGGSSGSIDDWALNFYNGTSHGTIARYGKDEPSYETVRAAVRRWLLRQP